jgi:hypothetical protein
LPSDDDPGGRLPLSADPPGLGDVATSGDSAGTGPHRQIDRCRTEPAAPTSSPVSADAGVSNDARSRILPAFSPVGAQSQNRNLCGFDSQRSPGPVRPGGPAIPAEDRSSTIPPDSPLAAVVGTFADATRCSGTIPAEMPWRSPPAETPSPAEFDWMAMPIDFAREEQAYAAYLAGLGTRGKNS